VFQGITQILLGKKRTCFVFCFNASVVSFYSIFRKKQSYSVVTITSTVFLVRNCVMAYNIMLYGFKTVLKHTCLIDTT